MVFLLSDSLHQVLSEFTLVRPIRTSAEGRFLSRSVTIGGIRARRQTPEDAPADPPLHQPGRGRPGSPEEAELFYNVTVFGHELHLRLQPNSRLVAPSATMEWWEESGRKNSQPIEHTRCFYTGEVSNVEDTSVAISNCDGLVGHHILPPPPPHRSFSLFPRSLVIIAGAPSS